MRKLKPLSKGKRLKGLGPTNTRLPRIPIYEGPTTQEKEDPLVYEIWQVMGGKERDLKLARQCATLQRERLPAATTPELIVYIWLSERGIDFEFQVEANGGRRNTGGSVVDFIVRQGKDWAWRVQGDYFHENNEQQGRDAIRRKLLIGQYAGKYQIDGVVDVWESDIYRDRENILTMALSGVQVER